MKFNNRRRMANLIGLFLIVLVLAAACGGGSEPAFPATLEPEPFVSKVSEAVTSGPTPSPIPLPTPTATPEPTATPVSVFDLGLVDEAAPIAKDAFERLQMLTADVSPRASATEEELAAAQYLVGEFEAMGYVVSLQPFSFEILSTDQPALTVDSPSFTEFESFPLTQSGIGQATGTLVFVDQGLEGDMPIEGLDGKVALIQRGVITFSEKVDRVNEAGAVAAVIFNDRREAYRGRLLEPGSIPVVAISGNRGRELRDAIASTPIEATVSVVFEIRQSRNVIAGVPGSRDDGRVVILGGHYDTVPDVPGANDNGSGIATLLTVAQLVADASYPFALRFVSFGSEELGLFGSRHYVDTLGPEERSNILAMLNFDALGTGTATVLVGTAGLVDTVVDIGRADHMLVERQPAFDPGTSSDHAPFEAVDIPVVSFLGGDYSRIHTPEDTLDFISPDLLGNSATLAIALLDSLAER